MKIVFIITGILIFQKCQENTDLKNFNLHLEYFKEINFHNYNEYEYILIYDKYGCEFCNTKADPIISKYYNNYNVKLIELSNPNEVNYQHEIIVDSGRIYYSFPFQFDGLTIINLKAKKILKPLNESIK